MSAFPPPPPQPTETPPAPTIAPTATSTADVAARLPQAGQLTHAWRVVTSMTWIGVVLALAAVWNTSEQLGLSTWWLGPRGQPQPRLVQLAPFLAPILMLLATINNVKRLGWLGLGTSGIVAAVGIIDLGRVVKLGLLELLIASAAAAVSIASLTGTYRRNEITGEVPRSCRRF